MAAAMPPADPEHRFLLESLSNADPLTRPAEAEANILWQNRYYCMRIPELLPKMLLATKWNILDEVIEMYRYVILSLFFIFLVFF